MIAPAGSQLAGKRGGTHAMQRPGKTGHLGGILLVLVTVAVLSSAERMEDMTIDLAMAIRPPSFSKSWAGALITNVQDGLRFELVQYNEHLVFRITPGGVITEIIDISGHKIMQLITGPQ